MDPYDMTLEEAIPFAKQGLIEEQSGSKSLLSCSHQGVGTLLNNNMYLQQ